ISYIDDVNIHLTGVAVAGRHIFTLSTFGAQYKRVVVSASIGQPTSPSQRDSAIPVTPTPRTGFARGRFFISKNRPRRCLLRYHRCRPDKPSPVLWAEANKQSSKHPTA